MKRLLLVFLLAGCGVGDDETKRKVDPYYEKVRQGQKILEDAHAEDYRKFKQEHPTSDKDIRWSLSSILILYNPSKDSLDLDGLKRVVQEKNGKIQALELDFHNLSDAIESTLLSNFILKTAGVVKREFAEMYINRLLIGLKGLDCDLKDHACYDEAHGILHSIYKEAFMDGKDF